mgnify:CR=1 FL=1
MKVSQFPISTLRDTPADAEVISQVCQGTHFCSHESMIDYIKQQIKTHQGPQTLLVKGANSAGMFKVAAAVKEMFA